MTMGMRHGILTAIVVLGLAGSAIAQSKAKTDVTGEWAFEVQTQMGTGTPKVTFKQEGEKLTGHYSSAVLGEVDFTGTVKGDAIEFTLKAEVQGNPIAATYTGTVGDNTTMKGTVKFGEMGEGTFTGTRK